MRAAGIRRQRRTSILKRAAWHAERLHQRRDSLATALLQRPCVARSTASAHAARNCCSRLRQSFFDLLERGLERLEPLELARRARPAVASSAGGLDAMLARDRFDGREPLLDPFLSLRVGIELRLVALDGVDAFAQRDQALVDRAARSGAKLRSSSVSARATLSARETACSALTSSASRSSCTISRRRRRAVPRCDRRWRSAPAPRLHRASGRAPCSSLR